MKEFKSVFVAIVLLSTVVHLAACDGCPNWAAEPETGIHGALLRNPVMVFQDSLSNQMTLRIGESGTGKYFDEWLECRDSWEYHEYRKLEFLSDSTPEFEFHLQYFNPDWWNIQFPDLWVEDSDSILPSDVVIDGRTFSDCKWTGWISDSTANFLIYNEHEGLVVIHAHDNYHWERVIN